MQKLLVIILCLVCMKNANAQRAYDGECIVGLEARLMTFNQDGPPTVSIQENDRGVYSLGSSSICDMSGRLAIGCTWDFVMNNSGDSVENWILNYAEGIKKFWNWNTGPISFTQSSIILPKSNNEYLIFTKTMSDAHYDLWSTGGSSHFDMLTYHVVDMNANNGLGKVVEKNKIIMKDAVLSMNRMTAVKHGNGRDWWLVVPHQREHIFYLFMVGQDGQISEPITRTLDYPPIDSLFGGQYGQSSFNHAGDKYAYCTYTTGGIFVLNFDRCSGEFSKHHFYSIPRDTSLPFDVPIGNQFSPNDSFLYVNTTNKIFQIDIFDTSASSLQYIHGSDVDSANEFFQRYSNIYMGGDDRLYIGNFHGVKSTMSYIDQPNKRGLACNFCRRCLQVPNVNAKSLPNIPWYHLGVKKGSACDSLSPPPSPPIDSPSWHTIKVYPNPTRGTVNVFLPKESAISNFTLTDISGRVVFLSTVREGVNTISLPALSFGVYIYTVSRENKILKRDKILIEK